MSAAREEDAKWMSKALALAARGEGLTRPNPPVGAVVVRSGTCVGAGYHKAAGGPHAEVVALEKAGARARGAELFVTLEPCCSWGRTPPCTERILQSGIARVVIATTDPNPKHRGRGIRLLRNAGIEVAVGVCRPEAHAMLEPFFKWVKTARPWVTLKLATSLDGQIADASGRSRWITGPGARAEVHRLRSRVDAVMVGAATARIDNPSLLPKGGRSKPFRVIVDRSGTLEPSLKVFSDEAACRTIVALGGRRLAPGARAYERRGAVVWHLPGKGGRVSLGALLEKLGQQGLLHVLCEGGGELAAALVDEGLVDRYLFFVAPLLIGGGKRSAVMGAGWPLARCPQLRFESARRVGRDLLIVARPEESECLPD